MEILHFLPAAFTFAGAVLVTYLAVLFGFRLLLHPLKDYPGPPLAKLSDAYLGYHALTKNIHLRAAHAIRKYGPVVRIGPNKLVFSSVEAVSDIYANERLRKAFAYTFSAATPGVYGVFNVVDKAAHRHKRKLVGQAISERSMRIFEPDMLKQIDIFLQILAKSAQNSDVVDMTPCVIRLAFDVVALLAFGQQLRTQTESTNRHLWTALSAANHRSNIFLQFPFVRKTGVFDLLEKLASDQVLQYYNTLEQIIAKRVAEDKHVRHDLYSILVDQMNPNGEFMKDSEIWAEAAFFFPAGADTVSTHVCGTLFYLAHNPHVYKSLAKEVRDTFKTGSDIKGGPDLSNCKYLRACLDETLRMSPPASGTFWRELDPNDKSDEPIIVDGHVIPRGVQVGVSMYSILHDERYFSDPFTYSPERWLEEDRKPTAGAFVPFSIGPRNCAGKAMAYAESSIVIAKVIYYFDFQLAAGKLGKVGSGGPSLGEGRGRGDEFQLYDTVSSTHDGPNLVFKARVTLDQ